MFTESGTYFVSITPEVGCDSLIQINLIVSTQVETSETVAICEGESYLFGGTPYTIGGVYTETYTTLSGCDSIVELTLIVNPIYSIEIIESICEGETYTVGDADYTTTGSHTTILQTVAGCDSIVGLNLTVHPIYEETITESICEGDVYVLGDSIYTTSGDYTHILSTVNSCDSIVHLSLVVSSAYEGVEDASICLGESYTYGDSVFTESGTYFVSITPEVGCDSLIQINLIVSTQVETSETVAICEGESYLFGGTPYTIGGVYTETYTTLSGCDSIVELDLTVHPIYNETISESICEGETYLLGDTDYTTTGSYTTTLQTVAGCDSIVNLNLTVHPTYITPIAVGLCEGESFEMGGNVYFEAGEYVANLLTVAGCDSTVNLLLSVYSDENNTEEATICEGESYVFFGVEYTESGTYAASEVSPNGCENTVTLILEVSEVQGSLLDVSICDGDSYLFEGEELTEEGIYSHAYVTSTCDSILILNLKVLDPSAYSYSDTICNGEEYLFSGNNLTVSGVYSETISAFNGCDSLITLLLVVQDAAVASQSITLCEGDSLLIDGVYHTEEGVYTNTYASSGMDCDSVVHTVLSILPAVETFEEYSICEGDSLYLFDAYYTVDTVLQVRYDSYYGCDSVVNKVLELLPVIDLLVEDYEMCLGETVNLSVFGADEVRWSPSDGLSCTDCPNPEARPNRTTTYTVTAEGCQGAEISAEVTVVVNFPPTISISTVEPDIVGEGVVLGDSVAFTATTNDPFATISWETSDGETLCADCSTVEVEPYYGVSYIATAINDEECQAVDEIQFKIRDGCVDGVMEIPNFITPNGDGHNDLFEIRFSNFSKVSILRIYNRWGELVYQAEEVDSEFWDGTFRGQTLNPDVYVYYLEGFCLNGTPFLEKGNVTILK